MKKISAAALVAVLMLMPVIGCSSLNMPASDNVASDTQSEDKVMVVTSFYPMYDFVQKIGGDRVDVTNLVPSGIEPHDWEPSTNDMRTIAAADLLVYNGAGMEHWIDDVADSIGNDGLVIVEASAGADLIPAAEDDEETGGEESGLGQRDDHENGMYDPHVWLSPANARIEMANIRDALINADPEGENVYRANFDKYSAMLDELDESYTERLSQTSSKDIVVSHQAFGYLCHEYGLTQVPIEGLEADSEPDARTMAEIIDFVDANQVRTIFSEELVSPKVARSIADATGATCEELNPLEGLSDEDLAAGEDYFSVMYDNLDKLVTALS